MGVPKGPKRLKSIKAWAVVDFHGKVVEIRTNVEDITIPALFLRRYRAAIVASSNPDWRVVPVALRSLAHRRR